MTHTISKRRQISRHRKKKRSSSNNPIFSDSEGECSQMSRTSISRHTTPEISCDSELSQLTDDELNDSQTSESDMEVDMTSRVLRSSTHGKQDDTIHSGTTCKQTLNLNDKLQVSNMRKKHGLHQKKHLAEQDLLLKLKAYHDTLSNTVDNIVTEKLTSEVIRLIGDTNKLGQPNRTLTWSNTERDRLDSIKKSCEQLQTPQNWTWAAADDTDQGKFNDERMKLVESQLKTILKFCKKCMTTSLLVGSDQVESTVCYDCLKLQNVTTKSSTMVKRRAWESVKPADISHPKYIGNNNRDLPELRPGDKAVLAPIFPCVTVQRKQYTSAVKFREESITLTQDPDQTWSHILPRTDLKNRFVVIERLAKNHGMKHIIANVENVNAWLAYLFDKHPDFIRMQKSGLLKNCSDALAALKHGSDAVELAEVFAETDPDDGNLEVHADDGTTHADTHSGFSRTEVFTFDKHPQLYIKAKDFLRIKDGGMMKLVEDRSVRVPIYSASANLAFPYLYSHGEVSPLDFESSGLCRYLLKKQTQFAHRMSDGTLRWKYAEDSVHMMHQYARLQEKTIHSKVGLYLTQHPDAAHLPIERVLTAFRDGFNEDGLLDSHLPGLSTVMAKLPNATERWFAERMGIEAISRDLGDANVFLTLNMDPRAWPDVRELIYKLDNGTDMPRDHPFDKDTEKFTDQIDKYSPQISLFLCRKARLFMRAFLCDICEIKEHESSGDWTGHDRTENSWMWGRVEFTESRGMYICLSLNLC